MDKLINKYRKNELSPSELAELKQRANSMTDKNIEECIRAGFLTEKADDSIADDAVIDNVKSRIDAILDKKNEWRITLSRWARAAVIAVIAGGAALILYLRQEYNFAATDKMSVTTGRAERANVTLSDGTTVFMNSESALTYNTVRYNRKDRTINFSGEGYFKVQRSDAEIPFIINANGLQVKVFGTAFNLSVRDGDSIAALDLDEGTVSLISSKNNQSITLHGNQKAVLTMQTGALNIVGEEDTGVASAWSKGDMHFRNTNLFNVIRKIEETYNINIKINCAECLSEPFTGTLPINDLGGALEVIEYSYHLKSAANDREIVLKRR